MTFSDTVLVRTHTSDLDRLCLQIKRNVVKLEQYDFMRADVWDLIDSRIGMPNLLWNRLNNSWFEFQRPILHAVVTAVAATPEVEWIRVMRANAYVVLRESMRGDPFLHYKQPMALFYSIITVDPGRMIDDKLYVHVNANVRLRSTLAICLELQKEARC